MDTPEHLTVRELADRWHCSTEHIRQMLKARLLSHERISAHKTLIPLSEVEAHEQRRTVKAAKRIAA